MNLALTLSRYLNTVRQVRHSSQILTSELNFPFPFPSHKDASPTHPRFQSPVSCFLFVPHIKGDASFILYFAWSTLQCVSASCPCKDISFFVSGSPIRRNSLPRLFSLRYSSYPWVLYLEFSHFVKFQSFISSRFFFRGNEAAVR